METGGRRRLASVWRRDHPLGDGVDDQWTLLPTDGRQPIAVVALVALLVVCAARFARPPRTAAAGDPRRRGAPFLDLLR
jgi:hypothetical protein